MKEKTNQHSYHRQKPPQKIASSQHYRSPVGVSSRINSFHYIPFLLILLISLLIQENSIHGRHQADALLFPYSFTHDSNNNNNNNNNSCSSTSFVSSSQSQSNRFPKSVNTPFSSSSYSYSSYSSFSPITMRAWTCHGRTHREMIDKLTSAGIVQSPMVKEALLRVDRANYVENREYAYIDAPQPIGHGQTISAPHMHAHVLEEFMPSLLKISKEIRFFQSAIEDDTTTKRLSETTSTTSTTPPIRMMEQELKILDVGSGSGYLTAVFGRMVEHTSSLESMKSTRSSTATTRSTDGSGTTASSFYPLVRGKVYGIDVYPQLVELARENMRKADGDLLASDTVTIQVGDGWKGLPEHAPFHAIHVGAAAEIFPKELMMQLYPKGGIMIIPIGPDGGFQNLYRVERVRDNVKFDEHDFHIRTLLGVRYVPLIHP